MPHPLPSLKSSLQKRLEGAARIGVLAVGSTIRGDDAAGMLVADRLEARLQIADCKLQIEQQERSDPSVSGGGAPVPPPVLDVARTGNLKSEMPLVRIFRGETAPENLTGEIKTYQPTHLIIIDSAELGLAPGGSALIDPDDLRNGRTFSTHGLPITVMVHYLLNSFSKDACKVVIIGIQGDCLEFGHPVHPAVSAAAVQLADDILAACHV